MKFAPTPLALVLLGGALAAQSQTKFLASDGVAGDLCGSAASVGASYALLGATGVDQVGNDGGAVYAILLATGQEWAKLVPDSHAAGFGSSVDVRGDLAVVGAPFASHFGQLQSGAAYLFDLPSGQQIRRLLPLNLEPWNSFGVSVALGDTKVLVGAHLDDAGWVDAGSAFVFDAATGQELMRLLPNDQTIGAEFGFSVAVDGETAIIGAPQKGLPGAAYLFDLTTGTQIRKFTATDVDDLTDFGWAVGISGDRVIVGAPTQNGYGTAYVFSISTGLLLAKWNDPAYYSGGQFGSSVAIEGERAIVGAPYADDAYGTNSGAAFLFDLNTLLPEATLKVGDKSWQDRSGTSVGLHGDVALVGTPLDDDKGDGSGSGTFFGLGSADNHGSPSCSGFIGNLGECACPGGAGPYQGCGNSTGVTGAFLSGAGNAALASDSFRLQVVGLPGPAPGLVLRGALPVNGGIGDPVGDGLLCVTGQTARSQVQVSAFGVNDFTDFQGQPFGASSYGAGNTVHYQYWYRDVQNTCTGQGFNFSNAWSVVWEM